MIASKLILNPSFHLEKSLSATTATTNDCTVLNTHCVTVTSILLGYSFSNADCTDTKLTTYDLYISEDTK